MSEEFEDEVMLFLMKAIVVSGCVFALLPTLARGFLDKSGYDAFIGQALP